MGFIRPGPDDWKRTASRILASGGPNTGKTTSLRTCKKPVHVVSLPGEAGANSIPDVDGVIPYVWVDDEDARSSSKYVIDQVEKTTKEIVVRAAQGQCVTAFGDGIHKFYEYYLDLVTGGDYFKGNEFEPKLYTRSHTLFINYLKIWRQSLIPYVFFTVWDGKDPDKPELKSQSPMHVYPDLPGKLARRSMGEFSFVISTQTAPALVTSQPPRFWFQLKADNTVHGAMIKIAPEIAAHLPATMEQDWQLLEQTIMDAAAKAQAGVKPAAKRVTTK